MAGAGFSTSHTYKSSTINTILIMESEAILPHSIEEEESIEDESAVDDDASGDGSISWKKHRLPTTTTVTAMIAMHHPRATTNR
jgi:hypothetical protein